MAKLVYLSSLASSLLLTCGLFFFLRWTPIHAEISITSKSTVEVPELRKMPVASARRICLQMNLPLLVEAEEFSSDVAQGGVISQHPLPGSTLPQSTPVAVTLSKGPPGPPPKKEAQRAVAEPPRINNPSPAPEAMEAPQTPTPRSPGGDVTVPSLTRAGLGSARSRLKRAGLTVGQVQWLADEDFSPGHVVRQSPSAGTTVPQGTPVNLFVNPAE